MGSEREWVGQGGGWEKETTGQVKSDWGDLGEKLRAERVESDSSTLFSGLRGSCNGSATPHEVLCYGDYNVVACRHASLSCTVLRTF